MSWSKAGLLGTYLEQKQDLKHMWILFSCKCGLFTGKRNKQWVKFFMKWKNATHSMWYTHYPTFYTVSVSLFYCLKYGHIFFSKQKMFSNFCISCNILYIQQLFIFYASSPAVIQSNLHIMQKVSRNVCVHLKYLKVWGGFVVCFVHFFPTFFLFSTLFFTWRCVCIFLWNRLKSVKQKWKPEIAKC